MDSDIYRSSLFSHLNQQFIDKSYTDNEYDFYFKIITEFRLLNEQVCNNIYDNELY